MSYRVHSRQTIWRLTGAGRRVRALDLAKPTFAACHRLLSTCDCRAVRPGLAMACSVVWVISSACFRNSTCNRQLQLYCQSTCTVTCNQCASLHVPVAPCLQTALLCRTQAPQALAVLHRHHREQSSLSAGWTNLIEPVASRQWQRRPTGNLSYLRPRNLVQAVRLASMGTYLAVA